MRSRVSRDSVIRGIRSDGDWFANFSEKLLVLFEGAQFRGKPMVLARHWREFFTEALAFDDNRNRLYETAVAEVPRKNAKSHTCAAFSRCRGLPRSAICLNMWGGKIQLGK